METPPNFRAATLINVGSVAPNVPDTILLNKAKVIIGRGDAADQKLIDPQMSQKHAKLAFVEPNWLITDLKSRTGTFVNSCRLRPNEPAMLRHGSQVAFGESFTFTFVQDHVPENYYDRPTTTNNNTTTTNVLDNIPNTNLSTALQSSVNTSGVDATKSVLESILIDWTCSICSHYFISPRVLNCGHIYCKHCLASWSAESMQKNGAKLCPICRVVIFSDNPVLVLENQIKSVVALALDATNQQQWQAEVEKRAQSPARPNPPSSFGAGAIPDTSRNQVNYVVARSRNEAIVDFENMSDVESVNSNINSEDDSDDGDLSDEAMFGVRSNVFGDGHYVSSPESTPPTPSTSSTPAISLIPLTSSNSSRGRGRSAGTAGTSRGRVSTAAQTEPVQSNRGGGTAGGSTRRGRTPQTGVRGRRTARINAQTPLATTTTARSFRSARNSLVVARRSQAGTENQPTNQPTSNQP